VKTILSTADVHQRDAFGYCTRCSVRRSSVTIALLPGRLAFSAKIQSAAYLSGFALVQYECTPIQNDVTRRHVAHADADESLVRRQLAGVSIAEQDGREIVPEASGMTLFDPRRPMRANRFVEYFSQRTSAGRLAGRARRSALTRLCSRRSILRAYRRMRQADRGR
jgi:hypothetical protein